MGKRKRDERVEAAELVWGGLAAWLAADLQRWADEAAAADPTPIPGSREAEAIAFHDNGLSGAFYWTWLYSGNQAGEKFGPASDGHIPCKRRSDTGWKMEPIQADSDRLALYQSVVGSLALVDRILFGLCALAPAKAPLAEIEWVVAQLGSHPSQTINVNGDGSPWTVEGVRRRRARIRERIAQQVIARQEANR